MPEAKRDKKTTVSKRVTGKATAARASTLKASKSRSSNAAAVAKRRPATKTNTRPKSEAYGNRTFTRTSSPHAGVSITVQIPPLRRPRAAGPDGRPETSLFRHLLKPTIFAALPLVIASIIVFGPGLKTHKAPAKTVATTERTVPDYRPLLPSAEKASTTKYDAKRNLVTYTLTFSGVRMTVSQQSLPSGFAKDPQAFSKAADNLKADQQIDTSKGPLRVATNEENGDQFGLYASPKLLVFIHAEKKLDDASWKGFIELLQEKSWEELI